MGFLAPAALALGAAIAIPIILHLFQRHQGPRMVFPALRYLRRAEREHARRIRLRQFLLLALRALALLLIAIVAARPFLRSGGAAHAPSAVVIVLDNSASSGTVDGDRRLLDVLKARAIETLLRAGPDDRFWLLRAGAPWEPALRGDANTIADRVRETEPTASAADLRAAVERAASVAEAGAGGRALEIQLLSDLQATNLRGVANPVNPELGVVVWSPRREPPQNRGVSDIEINGGVAPRTGERSSVAVRIAGNSGTDSVNIRLMVNGRAAAAGIASPGAAAVLQLPPQSAGQISGWAEIDADALRADDRRYFAVQVSPIPTVAVGRSLPFVEEAINVLVDAHRLARGAPGSADVVLAPAGLGLESARPDASVIVLPPESPVEIPAVNRRLESAGIAWRYATSGLAGEARIMSEGGSDPVLRDLAGVQIRHSFQLIPPPNRGRDSVLLRLSDGSPGSAWRARQRQSLRDARFPAHPRSLYAAHTAAMLPLLDRLFGAWTATATVAADVAPGEIVPLPPEASYVQHPDATRDTVSAGDSYRAPAEPGVYRVHGDNGREITSFVIDTSPLESDLTTAEARRLRAVLPGWSLEFVNNPGEWSREMYRHRLGRELWWPVIIALLLLLIVESLVAATGGTARASDSGSAPPTPQPGRAPARFSNR
jgi:hypothetical protein